MEFSTRGTEKTFEQPAFPAIEWEESPCPLCGGVETSPKIEAPDPAPHGTARWFLVVKCAYCGMCFTNPRPSAHCLDQFYPPLIPDSSASRSTVRRRWKITRFVDPLNALLPMMAQRRVLDFGCGVGSFLRRLHEWKLPFTAVSRSTSAAEFLRREWGVHAVAGSLPHPEIAAESFDVVTLFDLLEHVHQPLQVLHAAHDVLMSNGVLIVAVPNIAGLPYRWLGADWLGLDLPRHLSHFTPKTLGMMLAQAGFRLQRLRAIRNSTWLRNSAGRAVRRQRADPAWNSLLRRKPVASVAGWFTAFCRRANAMLAIAVKS
jgi:2-polyprenyl-3-methyl-5-hydroxy-6-metoxy-1,4-benzoquinol methylase